MTHPLIRFHRLMWRTATDVVGSLRRQAPGARMVGEFAVKHAVNEAQRRFQTPHQQPPSPESGDVSQQNS